MSRRHLLGGIEIFLLAAFPAWAQSTTGQSFVHQHLAIADLLWAAYTGFRAVQVKLTLEKQNDVAPAAPAEE